MTEPDETLEDSLAKIVVFITPPYIPQDEPDNVVHPSTIAAYEAITASIASGMPYLLSHELSREEDGVTVLVNEVGVVLTHENSTEQHGPNYGFEVVVMDPAVMPEDPDYQATLLKNKLDPVITIMRTHHTQFQFIGSSVVIKLHDEPPAT